MSRVFYGDIAIDILESVYEPREDSFLIAGCLNENVKSGEKVLEIGTGSGILAILAAKKSADVVATDINEKAIKCAEKNAAQNNVKIEFRNGNLFDCIKKGEKFDLIIFNPPYLPKEEKYTDKKIDLSYNSAETLKKFLQEYKKYLKRNGRALIVNSTLSGIEAKGKIIAEQKLAFEKIFVVELN